MRPLLIAFVAALELVAPVASAMAGRDPQFFAAQRVFESALSLDDRLNAQVQLVALGYTNSVPTQQLSTRMFEAIQKFQADSDFAPDGILSPTQLARLTTLSMPILEGWGFRKVAHPARGIPLWIPLGIGLSVQQNESGLHYRDRQERIFIDYVSVPRRRVDDVAREIVLPARRSGANIHYFARKDDWFVASLTTTDGADHYYRYHQDDTSVTGFALEWRNANGDLHAERIAVLMSAAMGSAMGGPPLVDPPEVQLAKANPQPDAVSPPVTSNSPSNSAQVKLSAGTGFFVNSDGYIVTNAHVTRGCSNVVVKTEGGDILPAETRSSDLANDLALLKVKQAPAKAASFRTGPRLGEGIEAFGFPHPDLLSSSGNFTLGNITALSGMGDDSRFLQISAPVQSGNSGGPLFDQYGNVVGVVTMKLNAIKVAMNDGDLPQNVNFALKTPLILTFLESNRVSVESNQKSGRTLPPADIADLARAISVFVVCRNGA